MRTSRGVPAKKGCSTISRLQSALVIQESVSPSPVVIERSCRNVIDLNLRSAPARRSRGSASASVSSMLVSFPSAKAMPTSRPVTLFVAE
jgi:hypothetical protein